jgi:hypothetical protein
MTKLLALELDAVTGKVTERFLTAEETKLLLEQSEASKIATDAKIAARKSALAKLAALGLTEEEIAAL